jgi:hypothetical protein
MESLWDDGLWAATVDLFLELRGHGATLSAADLAVVLRWKEQQMDPQSIQHHMNSLNQRCQSRGTPFPTSLPRLETLIRRMRAAQIGGDHEQGAH